VEIAVKQDKGVGHTVQGLFDMKLGNRVGLRMDQCLSSPVRWNEKSGNGFRCRVTMRWIAHFLFLSRAVLDLRGSSGASCS
jgi:hypothetical protein